MRVGKLLPAGVGIAAAIVRRAPTVTLDWDTRQKSRFAARDSLGRELAVFLARGQVVRGGDLLVAEDGSLLRVVAADQPVLVVTAPDRPGAASELTRAAYHLGNRHVPVEVRPDHLKIEPDHVLADMLRQMHLLVTPADAPFEPEGGAYGSHAHSHAHEHHDTHAGARH